MPAGAGDRRDGGHRPTLGVSYWFIVTCSRMLWVPVSTQMVLCTIRSMIASACTPDPSL